MPVGFYNMRVKTTVFVCKILNVLVEYCIHTQQYGLQILDGLRAIKCKQDVIGAIKCELTFHLLSTIS